MYNAERREAKRREEVDAREGSMRLKEEEERRRREKGDWVQCGLCMKWRALPTGVSEVVGAVHVQDGGLECKFRQLRQAGAAVGCRRRHATRACIL
jgi:hypothetical protein